MRLRSKNMVEQLVTRKNNSSGLPVTINIWISHMIYFIISTPKNFQPHLSTFMFHQHILKPKLPQSEIHKTSIFEMESLYLL